MFAEVQLELTALLVAAGHEVSDMSLRGWSRYDLVELGFRGLQVCAVRELSALVEDLLHGDDCRSVEGGHTCRKTVDEGVQLGIRECSVYPAVALGRVSVEILAAEDELATDTTGSFTYGCDGDEGRVLEPGEQVRPWW